MSRPIVSGNFMASPVGIAVVVAKQFRGKYCQPFVLIKSDKLWCDGGGVGTRKRTGAKGDAAAKGSTLEGGHWEMCPASVIIGFCYLIT
jgi:hypothetical protein